MKPLPEDNPTQRPDSARKAEAVCHQCGQPDAHAVGDELLCAACLHARGSCGAVRDETE